MWTGDPGFGGDGILCGTFCRRNAGLGMAGNYDDEEQPGNLNYGDIGMITETKGTLSFGQTAYVEFLMKRSMKRKDIGLYIAW